MTRYEEIESNLESINYVADQCERCDSRMLNVPMPTRLQYDKKRGCEVEGVRI